MTNKVEVSWKGQMLFESVAPEGSVMIDADQAVGGQGKGLRPKAMMLTSLAGCTAMDVASLLKKMRAEVDDFKIEKHYNNIHVINAPSPAATSCLAIADEIVNVTLK